MENYDWRAEKNSWWKSCQNYKDMSDYDCSKADEYFNFVSGIFEIAIKIIIILIFNNKSLDLYL